MDAAASRLSAPRGRVLVVDDHPDEREMTAHVLRAAGYEVSMLEDGDELLDVLSMLPAHYFQLVVTDQRMPGMLGTEVLARLGKRGTRFVILTGYDTPQVREAATQLGAAAFVRKPIDMDVFVAMLDEVVLGTGRC